MKMMINVILWLLLVTTTCAQDNRYYCQQYQITFVNGESLFGKPVCYQSEITVDISSKEVFIATDSIEIRFAVIHKAQSIYQNRVDYLLAIIGQPYQLYAMHELKDKAGGYYLGIAPTKFNSRSGVVAGLRLDISNKDVFNCLD